MMYPFVPSLVSLMLVMPGPGILAILAGVLLVDGGGKHALLRRAFRNDRFRSAVDGMRRRSGRPPLLPP